MPTVSPQAEKELAAMRRRLERGCRWENYFFAIDHQVFDDDYQMSSSLSPFLERRSCSLNSAGATPSSCCC
jgi:hypothetical protein